MVAGPSAGSGRGVEPAVRLDSVSKWFRGDGRSGRSVHALTRVTVDIENGEFVSFIGPSGCGKSTLLRLIGGLLEPDRGTVTVAGMAPDRARRRKHFGFVPQQPALLPWRTVSDNVALLGSLNARAGAAGIDRAGQQELLERVGLGGFADSLPRELSGGLQQRVSIARAFALEAPVLLLDEPFSALDEITRADMRYLLLDLWSRAGSTAVFVTHSIPEAVALSDRVVILGASPGEVITTVDIPLARPRAEEIEDEPVFHQLVSQVRAALKQGWTDR
ncbi:MAG: ABC transporter ATP-binding protein [Actinomycetota bacterium]